MLSGTASAQTKREQEQIVEVIPPLEELLAAAQTGDPKAELRLGYVYANGYYVVDGEIGKPDAIEAMKWFALAASHGHPDAQKAYDEVKEEYETTLAFRDKAATGEPQALYDYARRVEIYGRFDPNYRNPYALYVKAAEAAHAEAQMWLGSACEYGRDGAPRDIQLAMSWYKKAADQGHAKAFLRYYELRAVEHEFDLLRDAAMTGDANAQYEFAKAIGTYTFYRFSEAFNEYDWYKKAAEQGHVDSMAEVARYWDRAYRWHNQDKPVTSLEFADDRLDITEAEVMALYERAAKAGHRGAAFTLGTNYALATPVDYAKAYHWLERAGPTSRLCYLYYSGSLTNRYGVTAWWDYRGIPDEARLAAFHGQRDFGKAHTCYRALLAQKGGPIDDAHYVVGLMYLNGQGVARDEAIAYTEFEKDGSPRALVEQARLHLAGKALPLDRIKAYVLLNHAANKATTHYDHPVRHVPSESEKATWRLINTELESLEKSLTREERKSAAQQIREVYGELLYDWN